MLVTVILPLVLLGGLGWAVPWAVSRVLPEGAGWLVANGAISAVVLLVLAGGLFALAYGPARAAVWAEAPWYFALLAARSALVWAPVMVLSLANRPRHWTRATW
ncbi:hypothetical protein [Jannaschia ovalis]|uniref:Uncharacterized protein n=1 Tax=Jannaschia ovalis TaxID=3038773 RepID=A0ABY8L8Q5_9RHOB|nr:hypothetical protein [Jannaschia sp. GRR-S6-38]WGH77742.1 hypothetical protein P8627_11950 [Jannaschia sp. GRR-S6-38]